MEGQIMVLKIIIVILADLQECQMQPVQWGFGIIISIAGIGIYVQHSWTHG